MIDKNLNYGRHLIEKFLTHALPYEKVADLGAGHGDDLLIARRIQPKATLYAMESYPQYVKELQNKNIEVFSANIEKEKLPFPDESLDVIIMNQIMEHVKEVFWILHEVTRVLKVDGSFIVGVPNLASLHNRFLLLLGKQPTSIKNHSAHVRGYTKSDFKNLMHNGFPDGYQLKDYGGSNFYPFPPALAKPLASTLPGMAWGMFMRWKKVKGYQDSYIKYPINKQLETNFFTGN